MSGLMQDLRHAVRMPAKSPRYFFPAVISLGCGIGICTAMFTIVNAYLLRPLPIPRGEEVVKLAAQRPGRGSLTNLSYPSFDDIRDRSRELTDLVSYVPVSADLRRGDSSEQIWGQVVSGGYFHFVGARALAGRTITTADDVPSASPVVVISYHLWTTRFNSDSAVVGRPLLLNSSPFTVVGVMPDGFRGTDSILYAEFWVPAAKGQAAGGPGLDVRRGNSFRALGRLKPGGSLKQVQAELDVLSAALRDDYPDENSELQIVVLPETEARPDVSSMSHVPLLSMFLMGFAGVLLAISCANVTSLSLARATARRKQTAIRLAMGSTRFRVFRQFAMETVLVSLSGGVLGLLVVTWVTDWLSQTVIPNDLPVYLDLRTDMRVFAFSLLLSTVVGIAIAGIVSPSAIGENLGRALTSSGSSPGRKRIRLQSLVVVSQFAMLGVLLSGVGMLAWSLVAASRVDLGFRSENIALFSFAPMQNSYERSGARRLTEELMTSVEALPGVRAVSVAHNVPFGPSSDSTVVRATDQAGSESVAASFSVVSDEYFKTLDMPLLQGRPFDARDSARAANVVVVNEALAEKLWPGGAALYQQVSIQLGDALARTYQVVGVTRTGKYHSISERPRSYFYLPYSQHFRRQMTFLVRTMGDPGAIVPSVRRRKEQLDPALPLFDVTTLADRVAAAKGPMVAGAALGGVCGVLGTLLAGLGMYTLMSYIVVLNARGFALRVALGAAPAAVIRSCVGRGLWLSGLGSLAGLGVALGVTGLLRSVLFGVTGLDPVTVAAVLAVATGSTTIACYIPSRRILSDQPLSSLLKE